MELYPIKSWDISKVQEKKFHQDINEMKRRYQEQ